MLTGDSISANDAFALGMVAKVFPADQLGDMTLGFARRVAEVPTVAALLVKESVNQTVDNMGFHNSLNACFSLHELNHAHWAQVHDDGNPMAKPEDGVPEWGKTPPVVLAQRDKVRD
jgi:enoyl-CoA hydratase